MRMALTLLQCLAFGVACAIPVSLAAEDTARKGSGRAERRAEIERQLQNLRSEVWAVREAASECLKTFGAEVLLHLPALAGDPDPELAMRVRALQRHAQLAVTGLTGRVSELFQIYGSLPPQQRVETIVAMVQAGHAATVPLLLNLLETEEEQIVQQAILGQLGWLNTGVDGLNPLLKFYARSPEGLKGNVLWALAGIPCPESRKLVREALRDESQELRSSAVRSVLRLGDRECLDDLRRLAAGGKEIGDELRLQALEALTGLYDDQAGALFKQALSGAHALQLAGLKGIAGLRDRRQAPFLVELFRDETKKDIRDEVVEAMGAIGDATFTPLLEECLKREPPSLRIAALEALRQMDAKSSAPIMAASLSDGDRDVRLNAIHAVAQLGFQDALPRLKELLADPDREVAFMAAKGLANLGDPAGLARIVEVAKEYPLGLEQGGDLNRITYEAVWLIGQWQIEAGREVLEGLLPQDDENGTVRLALFEFSYDSAAFKSLLARRMAKHLQQPQNINAAFSLSVLYRHRGLDEQAIGLLEGIARRTPNQITILDRLATAYHEAGRYPECEAAFDRQEAVAGTNATYLNNRAWFYCTAFTKEYLQPGKALSMVQRSVSMEPRSAYIVDTLGWALHVSGKEEEATAALRRAFDLKEGADRPGRAWQRTRIARCLWAAGRKAEAQGEVEKALREAPDDAKVWMEAAGFYAATGRRDEAVHALHMTVDRGWVQIPPMQLNPEFDSLRQDPGYTSALQRVRKAHAALERQVADVEAEVQKALAAKAQAGDGGSEPMQNAENVIDPGEMLILED